MKRTILSCALSILALAAICIDGQKASAQVTPLGQPRLPVRPTAQAPARPAARPIAKAPVRPAARPITKAPVRPVVQPTTRRVFRDALPGFVPEAPLAGPLTRDGGSDFFQQRRLIDPVDVSEPLQTRPTPAQRQPTGNSVLVPRGPSPAAQANVRRPANAR